MALINRQISIFLHSIMFFTRFPVFNLKYAKEHESEILRYYSFLGVIIGGLQCVILWTLSYIFPYNIALLLMVVVAVLITGALHEDGLADTFDAFWGGSTVEKRELILKDSTLGTYGVMALILFFFLKIESLKLLESNIYVYIIVANVFSRFLTVCSLLLQKYGGAQKSKSKNIASSFSIKNFIINLIVCAAVLFSLLSAQSLLKVAPLIIIVILLNILINRKMGFMRGDFLGAIQKILEVSFYCLMVI